MKKDFEVKMSQTQQAAENLAAASVLIQKKLQQRSNEKKSPTHGRTSKKRFFAETNDEGGEVASDSDEGAPPAVVAATHEAGESAGSPPAAKVPKVAAQPAVVSGPEDILDQSSPESLVDCDVAKYFEAGLFTGRVIRYFPADEELGLPAVWRARYTDGDEEDYERNELFEVIELHRAYLDGELGELFEGE